ncbi:MAG: hypothetical protein PUE08_05745 [Eubacteriales bacterium]|nr:hypothetical protein [Eubacteriales bacterium]
MILSNELLYLPTYKNVAIVSLVGLLTAVILLIARAILVKKKIQAENVLLVVLCLLVLSTATVAAVSGTNAYKDTSCEIMTDSNSTLPKEYASLKYFDDGNIEFQIKKIAIPDVKVNTLILEQGDKSIVYFDTEQAQQDFYWYAAFEMNLWGGSAGGQNLSTSRDAINDTVINGLDYYIYETENSYVFNQDSSFSLKEVQAQAKKCDEYTMEDFENDVLILRDYFGYKESQEALDSLPPALDDDEEEVYFITADE